VTEQFLQMAQRLTGRAGAIEGDAIDEASGAREAGAACAGAL